jgi:hypothetical protein
MLVYMLSMLRWLTREGRGSSEMLAVTYKTACYHVSEDTTLQLPLKHGVVINRDNMYDLFLIHISKSLKLSFFVYKKGV